MTKFEVTNAMLDAAEQAYDTIAAIEHDAWCYTAPTRAAISAAIEASGILEENVRLRRALADIANGTNSWFNHAEEALLNARSRVRSEAKKALNKETTNDQ
jgi:hypothetical protein